MAEHGLVGRESELSVIGRTLARLASGTGGAVVVAGTAGVGKTALIREVGDRARSGRLPNVGEVTVCQVVGSEAERDWPYSGLHLVLSAALASVPEDRQADGSEAVDNVINHLTDEARTYEVAMRTLSLIAKVKRPIAVMIDDAHQFDVRSREVLGFVARRLRSAPVALVLAVDAAAYPVPLQGLPVVHLTGLRPKDAAELVRSAPGAATLPGVAARIAAQVGGNPRALIEVIAKIPDTQRLGQTELDQYLPWTPTLQQLHLPELDELDEARRFALLVATGSEDGRISPVLQALSEHDEGLTAWLLREHLNVSDGTFTLRRPGARSVIWQAATPLERRRAHEALAAAYAGSDHHQRLWHLAHARHDYDDEIAAGLEQASREFLARGEFERSLVFARESVRLTSGTAEHVQRLLLAGQFALLAGRLDEAVHIGRERFKLDTDERERADLALLEVRARNLLDGDVPTGLITRHVAEVAELDPNRAARLNLIAAIGFAQRMEQAEAGRFLALAEQHRDHFDVDTLSLYRRAEAWLSSLTGDLDRATVLIDTDDAPLDAFSDAERHVQHAMILIRAERFDQARRLLQVITVDRRFGESPLFLGAAYSAMVMLEIRAGRLGAAREAAEAWEAQGAGGAHRAVVPAYMIRAHAMLGENEVAWRCRRQSLERARRHGDWWATAVAQSAIGALLLLEGRFDEAISVLEHARRYALEFADPSILPVEPDYIEACFRNGEYGRAKNVQVEFEARAGRVPTAWAQHTLARCRALVSDGEASLALFEQAVETCADRVSPVELTRTLLCYGERLRRLGRRTEARTWLHRALVLAQECGAVALAARSGDELGTGGAAAPSVARLAELTEAEQRIVDLVAAGKRNREIAAELFVSVRTVEAHLGRIFRKLRVRSRTELTSLVMAGNGTASEDAANRVS